MPHSSLVIANEFIHRGLVEGQRPLTHMQVQKLVYLSHGWYLAACDSPLIEDQIEAWRFGPVIRRLYDALSYAGSDAVTKPIRWGDDTDFSFDDGKYAQEKLSSGEQSVIDLVWDNYGEFPAFKLSALTHQQGTPWSQTYREGSNRVIRNDVIRDHFKALAAG